MESLEAELRNIDQRKAEILEAIDRRNEKRTIPCACCGTPYAIMDLTALKAYWTNSPCDKKDMVSAGELQFVCPQTRIRNRILFDNNDVPWEERKQYANNPEMQFNSMYKKLFREVKNVPQELDNWVNNFYVDRHRAEFGLVEKRDMKPENS